jgi:hypothetical protein
VSENVRSVRSELFCLLDHVGAARRDLSRAFCQHLSPFLRLIIRKLARKDHILYGWLLCLQTSHLVCSSCNSVILEITCRVVLFLNIDREVLRLSETEALHL